MKNIFKYLISSLALIVVLASCKKEENKIYYEGGTAPVLTSTASGSIPLAFANKDQRALKLTWTNPAYQFTTGISSHDVTYTIEIDTAGSNFTNPNRKIITVSDDLSLDITQNDFNDWLLNTLQLDTLRSHNIEIRVTSSLDNNSALLYSNVLKLTATPYAIPPKVTPPPSGTLYFVGGDPKLGGWQNGGTYAVQSQQFTQKSPTLYEITLQLSGGDNTTGNDQYLFVPVWGDWSNKYACNNTAAQSPDGGDFGYNGNNSFWNANFPGPTLPGTYKITVDFQRGKYTVVKQ